MEPHIRQFEKVIQRFFTGEAAQIPKRLRGYRLESTFVSDRAQDYFSAFLILLSGSDHPVYQQAQNFLEKTAQKRELANFFRSMAEEVKKEIVRAAQRNSRLASALKWLATAPDSEFSDSEALFKATWKLFFPEGLQSFEQRAEKEAALRKKRTVQIEALNPTPLTDPAREILFTSNVLLTRPLKTMPAFAGALQLLPNEEQKFWYDHPVPLDMPEEKNEIIYGLRGLDNALKVEKERGNLSAGEKVRCVLSCSVTHDSLHKIAKAYVQQLIENSGGFEHLKVFLFTEEDTRRIVREVLQPAAERLLNTNEKIDFEVFGVDGEYGRHYTFLKAIAAFWSVLIDPQVKATFKIDLDQVFDQGRLIAETGSSALEMFKTPLWGAKGKDFKAQEVQLGLIAGALVNAQDIEKSLFTPDVPYPANPKTAEEFVFFSALPQALSTRAEMMTRYQNAQLDGKSSCLQRVHVTGGTNGALVQSLFRFKPFTPGFIGRAEDQAFILSVLEGSSPLLRYVHRPGLIMRHDKTLFAQEAIKASAIGKVVGDYVRMLYFSAYARLLDPTLEKVKEQLDPFTGSFISHIPLTVVMLRFAFKGLNLVENGQSEQAEELLQTGFKRLNKAIAFVSGKPSQFELRLLQEKKEWELYYQVLQKLREGIEKGEAFCLQLQEKAVKIVESCTLC